MITRVPVAFESQAHGAKIGKIFLGPIDQDYEHGIWFPGQSILVEILESPRRGRPSPWNWRNSTLAFSRANIAVTIGTKADGEAQCRSMVKE